VAAFALVLGLPLTYGYGGVRTFGYIAGAGGLAVVLVYLAVNVAVIRAFRTEFRDEFGLWRHLLVPATAIVLFLFPLWGILIRAPASWQTCCISLRSAGSASGVIVAIILRARNPSSFETLGRVFMPADGQPAYPLESAGNLAAGHDGQEGNGAHDGSRVGEAPSRVFPRRSLATFEIIQLTAVTSEDYESGAQQRTFRNMSNSGMGQMVGQSLE
jgi:hypothetical protein